MENFAAELTLSVILMPSSVTMGWAGQEQGQTTEKGLGRQHLTRSGRRG